MERTKTRLGILGAGAMGATHAAAYATMADVEVVGVFARDVEKARSIAALCKASTVIDARTLIEDDRVDAIDICLPSPIHPQFAIAALDRGKHVFCETPMALTMDEALAMREAAHKADRLLQIGLLMRSIDAYRHVRAAVETGDKGRLLGLSTWRLGSYLRSDTPDHKSHYGDPTTELMTFDFDVANWLMGRPTQLMAGGNGEITALLRYDDGRSATIAASGLMPAGAPFRVGFRALFEEAAFELETVFEGGPPRNTFTIVDGRSGPRPIALPGVNPYEVELRNFVDCVQGKADPALLDAEHAIAALALSLAAQSALATGAPVPLSG
ncbi:MAG TPA: Gfo/Idh/MocA family oxidoreductase [Reyranella sp.]|nr:Gfo/Idh/MocA family oxidoreductase [Reyranella sp.]